MRFSVVSETGRGLKKSKNMMWGLFGEYNMENVVFVFRLLDEVSDGYLFLIED